MKAIRGSRGVCEPKQQQQQQPRPRISRSSIGGRRTAQQRVLRHQARRLRHQPATDQSDVLPTNELPRGFGRTGRTTETADRGRDTTPRYDPGIRDPWDTRTHSCCHCCCRRGQIFLLPPSVYSKRHNLSSAEPGLCECEVLPPSSRPGPAHLTSTLKRNTKH